jgi:hypothetical protein
MEWFRPYGDLSAAMARKRKRSVYSQSQRQKMEEVWLAIVSCLEEGWSPAFKHRGKWHVADMNRDLNFATEDIDASYSTVYEWARCTVAKKKKIPKNQSYLSLRSMLRFVPCEDDDGAIPPESAFPTVKSVLARINHAWAEVIFEFVVNLFN